MSRALRFRALANSLCQLVSRNEAVGSAALQALEQLPGSKRLLTSAAQPLPRSLPAVFGFSAAGLVMGATAIATTAQATAAGQVACAESVSRDGVTVTAAGGASIKHKVIFVLGGPGSGKGTQCERLVKDLDLAHFSAGDLLREHVKSGTPDGNMVADMIKNGQIVPAEVTIGLLQKAMAGSGKEVILIDGFPRNSDNRNTFLRMVGYDAELVLFFDCPEDVLEKRLLSRNQGRSDDNIETIKKRFKVFVEQSMPVVDQYKALGKVAHIDTNRPVETIYAEVHAMVAKIKA